MDPGGQLSEAPAIQGESEMCSVDICGKYPKVGFNSGTRKSDLCYNMPDVSFWRGNVNSLLVCSFDFLVLSSDAQFPLGPLS